MLDKNKSNTSSELKCFLKILIAFIGITALVIVLGHIIGNTFSQYGHGIEYQIYRAQTQLIQSEKGATDLLIFGDSTASKALDVTQLENLYAISLTNYGGSLIDSYFFLDKYLSLHHAPKCAVIMTSYGAFRYHLKEYFWSLMVENGFYSLSDLIDLYLENRKLSEPPLPKSFFDFWGLAFKHTNWMGSFSFSDFQTRLFWPEKYDTYGRVYRMAKAFRGSFPTYWNTAIRNALPSYTPSEEHLDQSFTSEPLLDAYIEKMFATLEKNNVHTILLFPPIAEKWKTSQTEKWILDYKSHIEGLASQHAGIESHIQADWMDNGWFFDGTHLMAPGAAVYLKEKLPLLENCKPDKF